MVSLKGLAVFIGLVLLAGASKLVAWTPPILLKDSIASLESVQIGGIRQHLLIRGNSLSNPVVLFVHGGPGMPSMYLAHSFESELERDFVVVQWDQRGAGKSYDPNIPLASMNVNQFIADTREVTLYLEARFHQPKIFLIGHSWGSYLGVLTVLKYPELFRAYIGVGQIADSAAEPAIQDKFIVDSLTRQGNQSAVAAYLRDPVAMRETYLFQFHAELFGATDFTPLLFTGLTAPEYTIFDALNVQKGPHFAAANMLYNAISGSLMDAASQIAIPVYFFLGRHDYTTPTSLAVTYFDRLVAPSKSLVWFDQSAHFAFFEEPHKFAVEMKRVRSLTQ